VSFFNHLSKKADVLTEHSFNFFWFPQELQLVIEPLLSPKCVDNKDVAGLLALIAFAGIDLMDKEEVFKSEMIKKTFDDKFREFLQKLSSLLFGITVDKVRNRLFTFF
jgi:hypothetical protein